MINADADVGRYSRLELAAAWRVENATLWGKFAAERVQTQGCIEQLRAQAPGLAARVATAHLRLGLLDASRPIRKKGGCDTRINECYLFHGLGDPSKARATGQGETEVGEGRGR